MIPTSQSLSVVYVLSNPAMPGLVKIGRTSSDDATSRIGQLYTTSVPFPFKLEFACKVTNPEEVEQTLHIAFGPNRVNPKREFFQIDAGQAIAILKLLHTDEITAAVEPATTEANAPDIAAGEQYATARRPNLNFNEMGIPIGSVLHFVNGGMTATVTGPRKVMVGDEETSLTAATRQLLNSKYDVAAGPYWTFNGKTIRQIYNETYGE